jgi:hypothetical protein
MEAGQTGAYVDKRYEDRDINQLPDAPVEALRGLGTRGGEALRKAIGVKTIRDLATNDFVLKAQEVLRLAEGPTAIPAVAPAVAPAPRAATGLEPAETVPDREPPPLPVRRERIEVHEPDWER